MNISGLDGELPDGFPDVETIERLANEFFQAPPGGPTPGIPDTASLNPLNPLGGTAAPVISLPGEAELRALLAPAGVAARASVFRSVLFSRICARESARSQRYPLHGRTRVIRRFAGPPRLSNSCKSG